MKIDSYVGQVAYITGGSSGIGLAVAGLLVSKGAHVIVLSRGNENLQQAVKAISRRRIADNQVISHMQLDISDRVMCEMILPSAVNQFGPPTILINSAGISFPQKFEDISTIKFDEIITTNLNGTWNTIDILLPHLIFSRGYIVNVSSVAGFIGVFGMTAYSASKYAVIGFSEALRSELNKYNITVSVLCPPDVKTPMLEKANLIKPEESKAISATADTMEPDEVAVSLIKAMVKGKFMVIPNTSGRFINTMKRFFPGFAERIIDQRIRQVRKR